MAMGSVPTVIGVPAVLVAVLIGVTVPESSLATYAVTGFADPDGEAADERPSWAESAAACDAGSTGPSPAASEISTTGMTRHLSTARRAVVVPADMVTVPSSRRQ